MAENISHRFRNFFYTYFDMHREKEDELETIEAFKQDVDFRGTKMWILICAIMIASLGLNMNSTAVIIGAMLISPLMGPIIGIGLGLGITNFELVRSAVRNFLMASAIGILTSTVYFFISPLDTAQSELLARTAPNFYDVLIALFGGFAGIIAGASKSKGQVIPGVAIATALMPPLCTVGYGIASLQWAYALGALYLYTINAVFIGLATFLGVRLLRYPRMTFVDKVRGTRLNRLVFVIVLCTLIPSVFLAAKMVNNSYREERIRRFVKNELKDDSYYVLSYTPTLLPSDTFSLEVNLIGRPLSQQEIELLQAKLYEYNLTRTVLHINQGFAAANADQLRKSILSDVQASEGANASLVRYQKFQLDSVSRSLENERRLGTVSAQLSGDMKALFPSVEWADFSQTYRYRIDSISPTHLDIDTFTLVTLYSSRSITLESQKLIRNWIRMKFPASRIDFKRQEELPSISE